MLGQSRFRWRQLCLGALIAVGLISASTAQLTDPPDLASVKQTDRYLKRLGLDSLRIKWLERQVLQGNGGDLSRNDELASQLLQLYGRQMMSPNSKAQVWLVKTQNLLASFPSLESPQIQIAMAQAGFRRDEQLFHRWWQAGQPAETIDNDIPSRAELNDKLERTLNNLAKIKQTLQQQYEQSLAELQSAWQQKSLLIEQLDRKESELAHADYLLGWTLYLSAIINPTSRSQLLSDSNQRFREFLQIDPQRSLVSLEAKWIDFESEWHVRALAGLAITESGMGHAEQSQRCFELLDQFAISQSSRDLIPTWKLTSRLFVNHYLELQPLIDAVGQTPGLTRNGRLTFWKECWAGAEALQRRAEVVSRQLRTSSLVGLVRELETGLLRTCWDQLNTDPKLATAFKDHLHEIEQSWLIYAVEGLSAFGQWQSDADRPTELIEVARRNLEAARQAAAEPLDIASCELVLGRVQLIENDPEPAVPLLLHASSIFGLSARPKLAVESQWLAINSLYSLTTRQPRYALQTLQEIQNLEQRFPGTSYAQRTRLLRTRLNNLRRNADESVEALEQLTGVSAISSQASLEIVEIRYRQWLELAQQSAEDSTSDQIAMARERLLTSVDRLESRLPSQLAWPRERIKAKLLLTNMLIRSGAATLRQGMQELDKLDSQIANLPTTDPLVPEYQFNQLLIETQQGRLDGALQALLQLEQLHSQSRFYRSGLIEVTSAADQLLKQSQSSNRALLDRVVKLYQQLTEQLGSDEGTLEKSPNARVALTRLVELQLQQGRSRQAISGATRLYQLFPERRNLVELWAVASEQVDRVDDAITGWRKLGAASEPGSEDWHQAKLHLAKCLIKVGQPKSAQNLIEQTLQLSPQMPDQWREQFESLQQ